MQVFLPIDTLYLMTQFSIRTRTVARLFFRAMVFMIEILAPVARNVSFLFCFLMNAVQRSFFFFQMFRFNFAMLLRIFEYVFFLVYAN